MTLGEVLAIDVEPVSPVMPLGANVAMRAAARDGGAPVASGELDVSAAVEMTFAIR